MNLSEVFFGRFIYASEISLALKPLNSLLNSLSREREMNDEKRALNKDPERGAEKLSKRAARSANQVASMSNWHLREFTRFAITFGFQTTLSLNMYRDFTGSKVVFIVRDKEKE